MLLVLVCSPLRENRALQSSEFSGACSINLCCNSKNSSLLRALREGRANQSLGKALCFASF